ncbi:uncharacterized protein LOC125516822 [Triticum urartu]|uniref:uncharacterized protein LOC125516822 n=1 Tax=Triticum urartu TaxID=4572 RepID=UPI002043192E|nr:uncharacterized protein LOC125516822 [Triticum urartu]
MWWGSGAALRKEGGVPREAGRRGEGAGWKMGREVGQWHAEGGGATVRRGGGKGGTGGGQRRVGRRRLWGARGLRRATGPSYGATLQRLDVLPGTNPLPLARHPPLPPLPRCTTLHRPTASTRHPLLTAWLRRATCRRSHLDPGRISYSRSLPLAPTSLCRHSSPQRLSAVRLPKAEQIPCSCKSTATPATGQSPLAPLHRLLHRAKGLPLTSDGSGVRVQPRSPPQSPSHWLTYSWGRSRSATGGDLDLQFQAATIKDFFWKRHSVLREMPPYLLVGICKLSSFCSCSTTANLRKTRG